jgi:hypothetical protein
MIYEYGELRWNDTDWRERKNAETNLPLDLFVHRKSYIDKPGRKCGPAWWETDD